MTTVEDRVHTKLAAEHDSLSAALEVAAKVQAALPDGFVLAGWNVRPGEVRGQQKMYPSDDVSAIAGIVSVARMPGWSLQVDPPVRKAYSGGNFVFIAAVTEVDGVSVQIWDHIDADADLYALEAVAA